MKKILSEGKGKGQRRKKKMVTEEEGEIERKVD